MKSLLNASTPLALALNSSSPYVVRMRVLREIARLLDESHQRGEVHGDFNPGHILMTGNPETEAFALSISGFGSRPEYDADLLTKGALPESAYYLSPERILGLEVTPRSDQFSLAALAYESTYGSMAFPADDAATLFQKICTEPSVQPVQPGRVATVLNRALDKQPQRRYPSCRAFIEELVDGWQSIPPTGFVLRRADTVVDLSAISERQRKRLDLDEEKPPRSQPLRWRKPALLVALLAAAGLFLLYHSAHPSTPDVPQQTLDTRSSPVVPPPSSAAPAPLNRSRAAVKTEPRHLVTPPVPIAPAITNVQFRGEPDGTHVTVDKDPAQSCLTPCSLPLRSGRHTFVAGLQGYGRRQGILQVPEDRVVTTTLSKEAGTLIITSTPVGASVVIDGRNYGHTPVDVVLAPGSHRLTVTMNGQERQSTVDVTADSIQAKSFVLQ